MKQPKIPLPAIADFAKIERQLGHQFVLFMFVGQICAMWQQLEAGMEQTIWVWAGLSKRRGACFTSHMQFPLRCDVLQSLAHARFENPEYDKALTKLIQNRLKPAKAVRDRFAHALWERLDGDSNTIIEKPSRTIPKKFKTTISLRETTGAILKITNAYLEFAGLITEFQRRTFSPDTWPQKSIPPFDGYDRLLAAHAQSRAKRGKRRRPPRSSRVSPQ